ncbi:MAG TPA: hypothetical protein VI958_02075 [Acidobacteriota bacterium]
MELSERLKQKTELICTLILCDKISDETIAGERKLVRQWCAKFLPDKLELYDLVYESRFDRLIQQFR